jgi:hypothetical protein
MSTQILFGELYTVVEIVENWANITVTADNYNGWIDKKFIYEITKEDYNKINDADKIVYSEVFSQIKNISENKYQPLVAGSYLPFIDNAGKFTIGNCIYQLNNYTLIQKQKNDITEIALQFENAPYLWGGKTILGIDCSGFTQVVFRIVGLLLPRDASQQIDIGTAIDFIDEAQVGDLAFFDNEEGNIIHVGIILNNKKIIHASGCVRVDFIDHQGIYNKNTNSYSHKLRVIKRVINR